jgi:hypothetical protein
MTEWHKLKPLRLRTQPSCLPGFEKQGSTFMTSKSISEKPADWVVHTVPTNQFEGYNQFFFMASSGEAIYNALKPVFKAQGKPHLLKEIRASARWKAFLTEAKNGVTEALLSYLKDEGAFGYILVGAARVQVTEAEPLVDVPAAVGGRDIQLAISSIDLSGKTAAEIRAALRHHNSPHNLPKPHVEEVMPLTEANVERLRRYHEWWFGRSSRDRTISENKARHSQDSYSVNTTTARASQNQGEDWAKFFFGTELGIKISLSAAAAVALIVFGIYAANNSPNETANFQSPTFNVDGKIITQDQIEKAAGDLYDNCSKYGKGWSDLCP